MDPEILVFLGALCSCAAFLHFFSINYGAANDKSLRKRKICGADINVSGNFLSRGGSPCL